MKVPIADIKTDSGTQTRLSITEDVVADYAECMKSGAEFPPVIVFHDGSDYFMADGFHRTLGAARIGLTEILADVRKGTWQDALLYSLGANQTNGLRRTNPDKRNCVELALKEFSDWSDRKIAEVCGISDRFVNKLRDEVRTVRTCNNSAQSKPTTRTGRDGKQHPAHKAAKQDAPSGGNKSGSIVSPDEAFRHILDSIHCLFSERRSYQSILTEITKDSRRDFCKEIRMLIQALNNWLKELRRQA